MRTFTREEALRAGAKGEKFTKPDGSPLDLKEIAALRAQEKPESGLVRILTLLRDGFAKLGQSHERAAVAHSDALRQLAALKPAPPQVHLEVERACPVQWDFEIERDSAGKMRKITATPRSEPL